LLENSLSSILVKADTDQYFAEHFEGFANACLIFACRWKIFVIPAKAEIQGAC
jgi:hypothetical protein